MPGGGQHLEPGLAQAGGQPVALGRQLARPGSWPSSSPTPTAAACWNGVPPAKVMNCLIARTRAISSGGPDAQPTFQPVSECVLPSDEHGHGPLGHAGSVASGTCVAVVDQVLVHLVGHGDQVVLGGRPRPAAPARSAPARGRSGCAASSAPAPACARTRRPRWRPPRRRQPGGSQRDRAHARRRRGGDRRRTSRTTGRARSPRRPARRTPAARPRSPRWLRR